MPFFEIYVVVVLSFLALSVILQKLFLYMFLRDEPEGYVFCILEFLSRDNGVGVIGYVLEGDHREQVHSN